MHKQQTQHIWSKNFIMILLGQIVSLFGNAILRFALPLYLLEISGSAALFGTVLALSALPMIILSPIGGILADRVNKKKIMVVLDFITAAVVTVYMLTMGVFSVIPATVVIMMALFGIQAIMTPAVDGSIPLLVAESQLVRANSVVFLIHSLSGMLGPAIGGILFAAFGLPLILFISAIAFVLAAIMEIFIKVPNVKQEAAENIVSLVIGDIKQGLRFIIRENPLIGKITLVGFFLQLSLAAFITIGIPILITQTLSLGEHMLGYIQGLMGAGGILGGILAGVLGGKLRMNKAHILLFVTSILFLPLMLGLLLGFSAYIIYIILAVTCLIVMCINTLLSIQIFSFIQANSPEHLLGKVMSLFMMLILLGMPFGQFLFGMLFEWFAHIPWLVVLIAVIAAAINALNAGRYLKYLED